MLIAVYDGMDYLERCLDHWIRLRKESQNIVIAVVHNCFLENHKNGEPIYSKDGTVEYLKQLEARKEIDYLTILDEPSLEHDARNKGLKQLLGENCDFIHTIGHDEIYTSDQIKKIYEYVKEKPFITWFGVNYKNYVFDENHYVLGFCPPRIFRTKLQSAKLNSFYWDDDIQYLADCGGVVSYVNLSYKPIPQSVALVNHYTWLSDERGRKKVEYQEKHFAPPRGLGCGFKWDYERNKLGFNLDYYKKTGQNLPEVLKDEK